MTKKKKIIILGAIAFPFVGHILLLLLNGYGWMGFPILLPQLFGFWLLFMLGVGCSLRSIFLRMDRRILEAAQEETNRKKGDRIAVKGRIFPNEAQLSAPFSGKPCVLYEYKSFIGKKRPEAVGWAFVPSSVKTDKGLIHLLDYPRMMVEDFFENGTSRQIAKQFIQKTRFKKLNRILRFLLIELLQLIPSLSQLLFLEPPGENGEIRTDIDYRDKDEDFCVEKLEERIVAPGVRVIAIGKYDSKRNALVSGWMGLRLIPDSGLKEIRENFRGEIIIWTIASIFFTACWLFVAKMMDFWNESLSLFSGLLGGNSALTGDATNSYFKLTEFISFWFAHGRPPVSVFPFELNIAQLIAFSAVVIFPVINVIIGFKRSDCVGIIQTGLASLIYLCFYMLIKSGMMLEFGAVEEINRSLNAPLFTPLKALLFLAFLGSCGHTIECIIRKTIIEKRTTKISIFSLLVYSFLCLASVGLLVNFVKVEFIDNKQSRRVAANNGDTTDGELPFRKAKPTVGLEQQGFPESAGDLQVIFDSEYPCAKSLRIFVDGIESGTVNLPGRLRISLAEGAHQIAFGSPQDHADEITISAGETSTTINPQIDCKPLSSSSTSDFGIDLRELPLLKGANWVTQKRGELDYSSQIEVAQARDFYLNQLIQLGWQEKTENRRVDPNFFQTVVVKNNFSLIFTLDRGDDSRGGWTSITLYNKGNVDTRTLPRYPGAEILKRRILVDLQYKVIAKMQEVIDFTRRELKDAGWTEVRFDDNLSGDSVIIEFVKDGIILEAEILRQNDKTYLLYTTNLYSDE